METMITGTQHGDILYCTDIECSGEDSGTIYSEIIKPALEQSAGELLVKIVWEGGDYIASIHVLHGEITEEEVEL
jgi:hypothetical protein